MNCLFRRCLFAVVFSPSFLVRRGKKKQGLFVSDPPNNHLHSTRHVEREWLIFYFVFDRE